MTLNKKQTAPITLLGGCAEVSRSNSVSTFIKKENWVWSELKGNFEKIAQKFNCPAANAKKNCPAAILSPTDWMNLYEWVEAFKGQKLERSNYKNSQ